MTDAGLKSLAERIERLMDERDGIQSDIRDIYSEAKGRGYVPKVLRKAITRKRMDASKRDEEDAILDLYEDALSPTMRKVVAMAKAGASSHQIEQATGVDHSTVARSVALNKKSATASFATGSAHEGDDDGDSGCSEQRGESGERQRGAAEGLGEETGGVAGAQHAGDGNRDGAEDGAGLGAHCGGGAERCREVDGVHDRGEDASEGQVQETLIPEPEVARVVPPATDVEIDLTPPPALAAKRREIDARRAAP